MSWIKSLYLTPRFFLFLAFVIILFLLGSNSVLFFRAGQFSLALFIIMAVVDGRLIYGPGEISASRKMAKRFSNGDSNPILLSFENMYSFPVSLEIIDEVPVQFQQRNISWSIKLAPGEKHQISYSLRPEKRGEYHYGFLNCFVVSTLGLIKRRARLAGPEVIKVYPSFLHLKKFAFAAFDRRLHPFGIKKVRTLGHTMEFEQIKAYVPGDDPRSMNWKATARTRNLMVNQFRDERAQPVYMIIDKGRSMRMPFDGLSLLDYAINASLVMSYIALRKQDKAGLVCFGEKVQTILLASNRNIQMQSILETLYHQKTRFLDSDFERLHVVLSARLPQRSLLLIFTNFETVSGFKRQLKYLRALAKKHVLVVIFFVNTGIDTLLDKKAASVREIFHQTLAEKALFEKETIVRILQQHGIYSLLTPPAKLTIQTINKYLELKAKAVI